MAIIQLAPQKNSAPEGNISTFPGKISGLLSLDPNTASEVISGEDAGKLLSAYIDQKGWACLGTKAEKYKRLPYTVKLIQAKGASLIQVNPYEEKEALWYVVDAPEGAQIDFGVNADITLEQFQKALQDGTIADLLKPVPAAAGDVFDVKAGTVFSLGDGVTVLDIQKNTADKDFSMEDVFNSLILKPVDHTRRENEWLADGNANYTCLGKNDVFDADLFQLNGRMDVDTDSTSFKALFFVEGTAVIDADGQTLHAEKDSAFFVEADTYPFHITGNCKFILVSLV